ncbi:hypothetical protein P9279_22115 [Mesorhizobium sp. WSM4962]|uniref:hypothetical protein n=1 Tax=Mesorhizobium sp. WSM4962 TaxID=3038548 RepID=UPI0024175227|nr:hypothetical protein [Mesorhizobium sp. WSM4962]MDG4903209.1 hypothetical protein [Mesorhizobium sp. WSM4962]
MTCIVYVANTNIIELVGLKSEVEDEFIADADVTVTVKDADGEEVAGQTWPLTLASIDGTEPEGNYRGILKDTLELTAGQTYYAHVDADAGSDRIGHWEFAFVPKVRRGA